MIKMGAAAIDRVNASTLIAGYVIAVERDGNHLVTTRRKTGVLHATVTGKDVVAAGEFQRVSRYVIHTDQGDTLPVAGIQTYPLIAAPAVDAPAPAPVNPAELWNAYQSAHEWALAGDQDAPARTDTKPRTETFRGRRLRVERGREWGTLNLLVNGKSAGTVSGNGSDAMNQAAVQLRRDVLGADERRVTDPDAYPAHWYKDAAELPAAIVDYVRAREAQDARVRAEVAATTCTDAQHAPGVLGCPIGFPNCNGVPFAAHTITVDEVTAGAGRTGFAEMGLELRNALAAQLPDVGTLSTGETPWDHQRARRVAVWQIPAAGRTITAVYYQACTPLDAEAPYIAVMIDGQPVEGAAAIPAAQPSVTLTGLLAWRIREALAALPAVEAPAIDAPAAPAVPAVDVVEGADQGDTPTDTDAAGTGDVEAPAPAVPTIDGMPAGMPYMVTAPEGWNVPAVRHTPKELAKILKSEVLSAWFPGVKFSVRTDHGSMYQGLNVSWTDGPAARAVDLVTDQWAGITGKSDYRGDTLYVNAVGDVTTIDMPGVYVSTSRDVSPDAVDAAENLSYLPSTAQIPAGWMDPFMHEWHGGSRRDCARWLAGMGVDGWARLVLLNADDACPIKGCRLFGGHPIPGIHVNDYGRHFFGTLPAAGDGDQSDGGEPTTPGPDVTPGPVSFRTWEELAEHIRPGATRLLLAGAGQMVDTGDVDQGEAPAPAGRVLTVVNTGRGSIRVHKQGCRDAASAGTSWDVTRPDLRGVVVDVYGNGDFEDFDVERWSDWSGGVEVLPCVGTLPDVAGQAPAAGPAALAEITAPAIRPQLGDWVHVSGWSGVSAFVLSVQQDAVGGWDTGETLRFPVGKVTAVTVPTLGDMRHTARLVLDSAARAADIVEPARAILDIPTWESGAPKAGEGVRVDALNTTDGQRLDDVELLAHTVTKLGCGCWRIECHRPGPVAGGYRSTVALHSGCHRHDAQVSVPLPTTAELDEARKAGREAHALGIPAHIFPTSDERIAPTFKRLPVGSAVYSALITAYHEGYEQAAEREVRAAGYAATISAQNAAAGAEIAERNPATAECAAINAAGAVSAAVNLERRTAELAEVRAVVAGDEGDADQGDGEASSWAEFYTLDAEDYAPAPASDEADEDGNLITIMHSHEDGTVIDGSAKGDGVYEIAHRHGFTFRPSVGIFIQGSRDKFVRLTSLSKLAGELREAGHRVAFDIDDVWRPAAVREEARAGRVSEKVERLSVRSGRRFAEANGRRAAAEAIGDRMPFGEPIKVGHHSERAHRRAFERIEANYRAAYAAYDYAEHLNNRAEGAEANEDAKQNPRAIMRRIERIEADKRKYERELSKLMASDPANRSAYRRRLRLEIERITEDVAYQLAKLGDKAASGEFVAWSKGDFRKDDFANIGGTWCKVLRANAKTLSVENRYGWGGDGTAPYDEVHGRRRDGMQWDAPNATGWLSEDAVKVAKWNALTVRARRAHPGGGDQLREAANQRRALCLVLGLPASAGTAEVDAYGEPADEDGKRRRALAAWSVYERLTAGETFEQIAATVEPLNDSTPRWVMPTGTPEDVRIADLVVGDMVVGIYDTGFAGSRPRLIYSMEGPVTGAPTVRDRHESGEWVTIEVDGTNHDARSFRRVSAHLVGARN